MHENHCWKKVGRAKPQIERAYLSSFTLVFLPFILDISGTLRNRLLNCSKSKLTSWGSGFRYNIFKLIILLVYFHPAYGCNIQNNQEVLEVLNLFNIEDVESIDTLKGSFHSNWLISTKKGIGYVLKSRDAENSENNLKESYIQNTLFKIIKTAKPLKSTDGDFQVRKDDKCYTCFEYIEGRSASNQSAHDLFQMGVALARLHKVDINSFDFEKFIPSESPFQWSLNQLDLLKEKNFSSREIASDAQMIFDEAEEKLKNLKDDCNSLIHWDFHTKNISINDDKVFVFDFEHALIGPRAVDFANSIILVACLDNSKINWEDASSFIQDCSIDFEKFYHFYSGYRSEFPLPTSELTLIPDYMKIAWIGWVAYTLINDERSLHLSQNCLNFCHNIDEQRREITELLLGKSEKIFQYKPKEQK